MATIYKYPIPKASEPFELKIKGFCEVVHVGIDGNDTPCLWAIVNPNMPEESWKYLIVATGQEFDVGKWCHVKTFQQGQFVWHLLRPLDDWNRSPSGDGPVGSLVYIIASRRKHGLPGVEKAMDGRFYYTYADAEAGRQLLSDDLKETCAVFSIHAVIQQEVTFEPPF
jgi:hypothetical protein